MSQSSGAKPLLSLSNDYDHYVRCVDQLYKNVAGLEDLRKWVNTTLGQRVLEKLNVSLLEGERLKILGVGSGDGRVEYNLISRILTKYPKIHNTVVDPSEALLKRYKNLIKTKQAELDGVEYDWRVQTLSEYRLSSEESGDETKFHLISASCCLYYEPNLESVLSYLYGRLAPGGILLTALESEECHYTSIERTFHFAEDEQNLPSITNKDVCAYFKKLNIPAVFYHQPGVQPNLDITACFDDESQEGALLLDILSSAMNFRENASPATVAEFRAFLKTLASVRSGKIWIYYDIDYVLGLKI